MDKKDTFGTTLGNTLLTRKVFGCILAILSDILGSS